MAAASVKALLGYSHPATNPIMAAPSTTQQERDFKGQRSSTADEVLGRSDQEELGGSSHNLGVDDFELVRTLGTGISNLFINYQDLPIE